MKGRETGVSVSGNLGGKKHRKLLDLLSDIQLPDGNVFFYDQNLDPRLG